MCELAFALVEPVAKRWFGSVEHHVIESGTKDEPLSFRELERKTIEHELVFVGCLQLGWCKGFKIFHIVQWYVLVH